MSNRIHQRPYESKADYYCRVSQHVVQEGAARASEVSRLLSEHEVRSAPADKSSWRKRHDEMLAKRARARKNVETFYEENWNGRVLSRRKVVLDNPSCTSLQKKALRIQRELRIYPGGSLNEIENLFFHDTSFSSKDPRRYKVLEVESDIQYHRGYGDIDLDDLIEVLREDGGLGNKCAKVAARGAALCSKALYRTDSITQEDVDTLQAISEEIPGLIRQVRAIENELESRVLKSIATKEERIHKEIAEDRARRAAEYSACPCVIF